MTERVFITGFGLISSLGNTPDELAESLMGARSGIVEMPGWRELGLASTVAGDIDPSSSIERSELGRRRLDTMGKVAAMSCLATEQALAMARLDRELLASERFGALIGSGVGSMPPIHDGASKLFAGKARRIRPYSVLQSMSSAASAHVVQAFGVGGRSYSIASACSTSAHSIGHGFELVRAGVLDGALVGGAEEVNEIVAAAFCALRAGLSSRYNEEPQAASRPFDRDRDGFVLSGGAGILVLESERHASARHAAALAEVLGFGSNSTAYDPVLPEPEGIAAGRCMELAIADAGIELEDVDVINAHATGTATGDPAEALAIRRVFGEQAPSVVAPKSQFGHALGAAGVLELIASLTMIDQSFVSSCVNLDALDDDLGHLPYVRKPERRKTRIHLSSSFGFGGTNASLVIGAPS